MAEALLAEVEAARGAAGELLAARGAGALARRREVEVVARAGAGRRAGAGALAARGDVRLAEVVATRKKDKLKDKKSLF